MPSPAGRPTGSGRSPWGRSWRPSAPVVRSVSWQPSSTGSPPPECHRLSRGCRTAPQIRVDHGRTSLPGGTPSGGRSRRCGRIPSDRVAHYVRVTHIRCHGGPRISWGGPAPPRILWLTFVLPVTHATYGDSGPGRPDMHGQAVRRDHRFGVRGAVVWS